MKVKQRPEDFQVEELTSVTPGIAGEFALYRLDKTGWTTPDALAEVRHRWRIDHQRVAFGGLKDRHAVTSQYLTIFRGPRRNLTHQRIALTYLGQRYEPYSSTDVVANRFSITLRAIDENTLSSARSALAEVEQTGLANYFDDQRFGSVGEPAEFVAREMVFGRFDRALWLALVAPYEFDVAAMKHEKAMLRTHWGDWHVCKKKLPKGHARKLVDYLVTKPTDFKGAVARLRPEWQGLYLSVYQSHLWNLMLAEWLTSTLGAPSLAAVDLKLGQFPMPIRVPEERLADWESLVLPLPSARIKPEPGAPWVAVAEKVLKAEGLTLADLKIKGMHKPFFSKGDRAGCIQPANLSHTAASDEENAGKQKLRLMFDLPRGSYATILLKRLTVRRETAS